jgi:carbamoyltransferase
MGNILGISAGFHDAGVSVIDREGNILFASHSERFSKQKHDAHLCDEILAEVEKYGPIDTVAYYENHWLKKIRQLRSGEPISQWKFSLKDILLEEFAGHENILHDAKLKMFSHHKSHAAAGFQTSPYKDATVVVIDAIGELDTVSIWHAEYDKKGRAKYKKLWGMRYPQSVGLFYSAMTQRCGLRPLDEEYILMGMVAYGRPHYTKQIMDEYIERLNPPTFKYNLHVGVGEFLGDDANYENIATSTQEITEQMIYSIMSKARQLGTSKNLVYMGGVALNCLANRNLGNFFDNIWIMPNPGDAGSSLGAAALAYGKQLNWKDAFLGKNIVGEYPVKPLLDELLNKKIVGVASGRAEFGPRALGTRSLLADPRGPDIKDRVNDIKRRQRFRPFAPVILEEYVDEYFDMPKGFETSPYMQVVAHCKKPAEFPAIIHADGTSRVQTVPKDNTGIRKLLEAWYNLTGCPMLLNTSLNIRGEPMVNDRTDADRFEKKYGVTVCS